MRRNIFSRREEKGREKKAVEESREYLHLTELTVVVGEVSRTHRLPRYFFSLSFINSMNKISREECQLQQLRCSLLSFPFLFLFVF